MSWPSRPLADVAEIQGGIQKQPQRAPRTRPAPFLRVANVTARGLDLTDVHAIELFDGDLNRYGLRRGDLLVVEGNGSASQIGRAAVWDASIPNAVHQNHLIRVRPGPQLNERYLGLVWNSPAIRDELSRVASSTSGLHTLSVTKLKRIHLPVPPLDEQRRIVDLLEDHLSRLDAAEQGLRSSGRKHEALWLSALSDLRRSLAGAPVRALGQVADTSLGKMLDAKKQTGVPTPYLRNVNVRWRKFDLSDLRQTPLTEAEVSRFDVLPGDVLACEGGEPGRCAVWRGPANQVAYQKALHRIRVRQPGRVLPDFLALMLEEAIRSGQCDRLFTGTTIKHLTQEKLRTVTIPVPDPDVQRRAMQRLDDLLDGQQRLSSALTHALEQGTSLRRSLLAAAFSGRLTRSAEDLSDLPGTISAEESSGRTNEVRSHAV